MWRQAFAVTLSILLSGPVWATTNPLGTVASGDGVSVAGAAVVDGSTLYNGDTLSVLPNGNVSVILNGGSRARMAGDSQATLSRDGSSIALDLLRGEMQFTSSANSPVEGKVADVTFRPENPSDTSVAYMTLNGSNHTVLYANRGDWVVTTAHDGHSLILRPGEHIEGRISAVQQDQNQDNTVQGQQQKKKRRKMAVIWIGTAAVGAATGLGMAFGMSECNAANDPHCSMSPNTLGGTSGNGSPQ